MNRVSTLGLALLLVSGCSSSRVAQAPVEPAPEAPAPPVERFDAAPYVDEPAPVEAELTHDVPERLLRNQAGAGTVREVGGFRVQVFSTLDLTEAAAAEEEVKAYWQTLEASAPESVSGLDEPAVYRFFRQPYYRIRVGDFPGRARADRVAKLLAQRFPGAFVVPDRVRVRN